MHVPDGFLDAPTCVATTGVALVGVAHAVRLMPGELPGDRRVPLAGLVATLVFAVQMVNLPVGDGTSGHLMGGALAAALVGPATAVVCIAGVLVVQAVLFADGGLSTLGTNVVLMALVGVGVGWVVQRGVGRVLAGRRGVVTGATVGALLSVPASAAVFTLMYAMGGTEPVGVLDLAGAMLGWHALIGLVEAGITAAVVASVVAARPDLVHALERRAVAA